MKLHKVIVLFIGLNLTACLPSSGGGGGSFVAIPDVSISCNSIAANQCVAGTAGQTFYVGLTYNTVIDCEATLLQADSFNFAMLFNVSGNSTTSFVTELEGTVTSWVDPNGYPTTTFAEDNYVACSFVDTNGNGQLDDGEPIGQQEFLANSNSPLVQGWFQ